MLIKILQNSIKLIKIDYDKLEGRNNVIAKHEIITLTEIMKKLSTSNRKYYRTIKYDINA
ncbi:hypothetical protein HZY83_02530 [Gemella sp. GH3]|uniref:hypothetical protein n=1 Tax=unclassified Gemella TaxID=2624949 RepID=UPI0015D017A0|nr:MULTISPECIES: hypothetical protein [unclassified Gemella]MBF0713562.1 hypothetical protein [Gemella sp. GH3.1]NYS50514.1 hypothetical protein [Gemella sp. GH3]